MYSTVYYQLKFMGPITDTHPIEVTIQIVYEYYKNPLCDYQQHISYIRNASADQELLTTNDRTTNKTIAIKILVRLKAIARTREL